MTQARARQGLPGDARREAWVGGRHADSLTSDFGLKDCDRILCHSKPPSLGSLVMAARKLT